MRAILIAAACGAGVCLGGCSGGRYTAHVHNISSEDIGAAIVTKADDPSSKRAAGVFLAPGKWWDTSLPLSGKPGLIVYPSSDERAVTSVELKKNDRVDVDVDVQNGRAVVRDTPKDQRRP